MFGFHGTVMVQQLCVRDPSPSFLRPYGSFRNYLHENKMTAIRKTHGMGLFQMNSSQFSSSWRRRQKILAFVIGVSLESIVRVSELSLCWSSVMRLTEIMTTSLSFQAFLVGDTRSLISTQPRCSAFNRVYFSKHVLSEDCRSLLNTQFGRDISN